MRTILKNLRQALIAVFVVGLILLAGLGFKATKALVYKNPQTATLYFVKGTSARSIAKQLKMAHVIADDLVFIVTLKFRGEAHKLKAGEYEFAGGMGLREIIDHMVLGRVKLYKLTIPEGFNLKDICALVRAQGLMTEEECVAMAQDVSVLKQAQGVATLEGYLFPDTYLTHRHTTSRELFAQMVALFYEKIGDGRVAKALEAGFTLHQLITLASVVEKETGLPEERPLIAAVFLNRLKQGLLLQSDPTVIYGIKGFDGNLTKTHLQTDTSYNTYTRAGLPPGPICSMGLAAIDAVLHPAQTDALYFVAKGDGSHYFSVTLEEHTRAVRMFQLEQ